MEEAYQTMLEKIVDNFEIEGCENCGTVPLEIINEALVLLGREKQ